MAVDDRSLGLQDPELLAAMEQFKSAAPASAGAPEALPSEAGSNEDLKRAMAEFSAGATSDMPAAGQAPKPPRAGAAPRAMRGRRYCITSRKTCQPVQRNLPSGCKT